MWVGIKHNGRIPFHIFEVYTVTLRLYCKDILQGHISLSRCAVQDFCSGITLPLRTAEVFLTLAENNIYCMRLLAYSLGSNPIKTHLDALSIIIPQRQ